MSLHRRCCCGGAPPATWTCCNFRVCNSPACPSAGTVSVVGPTLSRERVQSWNIAPTCDDVADSSLNTTYRLDWPIVIPQRIIDQQPNPFQCELNSYSWEFEPLNWDWHDFGQGGEAVPATLCDPSIGGCDIGGANPVHMIETGREVGDVVLGAGKYLSVGEACASACWAGSMYFELRTELQVTDPSGDPVSTANTAIRYRWRLELSYQGWTLFPDTESCSGDTPPNTVDVALPASFGVVLEGKLFLPCGTEPGFDFPPFSCPPDAPTDLCFPSLVIQEGTWAHPRTPQREAFLTTVELATFGGTGDQIGPDPDPGDFVIEVDL